MITTTCSCGFTIQSETMEEAQADVKQHFIDNVSTHVTDTMVGTHLHVRTPKNHWVKRLLQCKGYKK